MKSRIQRREKEEEGKAFRNELSALVIPHGRCCVGTPRFSRTRAGRGSMFEDPSNDWPTIAQCKQTRAVGARTFALFGWREPGTPPRNMLRVIKSRAHGWNREGLIVHDIKMQKQDGIGYVYFDE